MREKDDMMVLGGELRDILPGEVLVNGAGDLAGLVDRVYPGTVAYTANGALRWQLGADGAWHAFAAGEAAAQSDWAEADPSAKAYIRNKPVIPAQVQADWSQSDSTAADYIKNKPVLPAQAQADWSQTDSTAADYIRNKPVIPVQAQADWSQSDSAAADYIKNRVGGYVAERRVDALLSDTAYQGQYAAAGGKVYYVSASGASVPADRLTVGETYTVTFDGVDYELAFSQSGSTYFFVSHSPSANTSAIQEYGFAVNFYRQGSGPYTVNQLMAADSDAHTLGISKVTETVVKVPRKFLDLAQADWSQSDATAADYIKNKPALTSGSLTLGSTTLTEAQLIQLLALLESGE